MRDAMSIKISQYSLPQANIFEKFSQNCAILVVFTWKVLPGVGSSAPWVSKRVSTCTQCSPWLRACLSVCWWCTEPELMPECSRVHTHTYNNWNVLLIYEYLCDMMISISHCNYIHGYGHWHYYFIRLMTSVSSVQWYGRIWHQRRDVRPDIWH